MDETTQLRILLTRAAEDISEVKPPVVVQFRERRRQRGHRIASVLTAVAAVLLVVSILAVAHRAPRAHPPVGPAPLNAMDLAAGHWSTLPVAPIQPRDGAASVWTGRQMLIWGGEQGVTGTRLVNTGAAYDPTTRTWTVLPPSPLSPRVNMASVWTGRYWLLWGGDTSSTAAVATDGALYNPSTQTWQLLPSVAMASDGRPRAAWNGTQVIVVTAPRASTVNVLHGAAFNPSTDRWTPLADIVAPRDHPLVSFVALASGSDVYAWYEWNRTIPLGNGAQTYAQGVDGFALHAGSTAWAADSRLTPGIEGAEGAIALGSRVYLPAGRTCWGCLGPGPYASPLGGVLIDPGTGGKTTISAGPVAAEQRAAYAWTGHALLAFNYAAGLSSPTNSAAAWDPPTNTWTTLAREPHDIGPMSNAVWTGSHLLVWGFTNQRDPIPVGLQFGP